MKETHIACGCGEVTFTLEGEHLLSVECCCESCRRSADFLEALPGAEKVRAFRERTPFVLYRKDRVRCTAGATRLAEYRLGPEAKTRRVVATCCNTAVFMESEDGHWLSLFGCRWPEGTRPPLELRTMASDLPEGCALPGDVPNSKTQSPRFMLKLLGAWIAMGFRVPEIDYVQGRPTW
jgi:hypothetical protein